MMNLWSSIRDLMFAIPFTNQQDLANWSNEIQGLTANFNFRKVEILVFLPKGRNKSEFEGYSGITFVSPKDFSLFGKIKDEQLKNKLLLKRDAVIGFDLKLEDLKTLSRISAKSKIAINCIFSPYWDIYLNSNSSNRSELINFAKNTLTKISIHE